MNSVSDIAEAVLHCAVEWEPEARILGNVTAREVAKLAAHVIESEARPCPACGAEPWVNIDCGLCCAMSALAIGGEDAKG